jgi:hypothetical protein
LSGYWWLEPREYVHDAAPATWRNKELVVQKTALARFEDYYQGADRSLSGLTGVPEFNVPHRERRSVAMRRLQGSSSLGDAGAVFLLSVDYAELLRSIDPGAINATPAKVFYNGVTPSDAYLLADAARQFEAFDIVDRAYSAVTMHYGFKHDDGTPFNSMSVIGPIKFGCALPHIFRLKLHARTSRLLVSDQVADEMFNGRYPGVVLEDATRSREPALLYKKYGEAGWDEIYPA